MVKERNIHNPTNIHFVDIHEVPEEEEEEEEENEKKQTNKMAERPHEKRLNRPPMMKFREGKRSNNNAHRSFSRQVSLETGVSKLNKAQNDQIKVLPRSGRSFGGFGSSHGVDAANVKKGDFNMFRTKSTLSKQNSFMLPLRKDSGVNQFHKNGEEGVGLLDETFDKSVPAGRYFAALTGPELDQVKVLKSHS